MEGWMTVTRPDSLDLRIAVVGMAGRFPGAPTIARFWQNLREGVEAPTLFSEPELRSQGIPDQILNDPMRVRAGFSLEAIDKFDASFFGFTPRDAELADPQQRLLLECAWEAIESAGYDLDRYGGVVGVFVGSKASNYAQPLLASPWPGQGQLEHAQLSIANDRDYLATRVSYKLDLRGPSVVVQTACSTSLVAVHMACQSLLNGECDMAMAGGVAADAMPNVGYRYQEGGILSPDGHCRPFDREARGTVPGDGVGIVVLKRLAEAIDQGDLIHAAILGSAVNNDGADKVGYTAPSVHGQIRVISEALAVAGVPADTITYVEAHGTGTALGDPIEIAALTEAFRVETDRTQFCGVGSVKSNIGHLDAAAGVAGLIKTVLALEHGELPPSLNVSEPNPVIPWASSPFFVNTELRPWHRGDGPRRAGVSSFGIGGTNAHVVLEEAPERPPTTTSRPVQVLPLSARTPTALLASMERLTAYQQQHRDISLPDTAHTYRLGRKAFDHRAVVMGSDVDDTLRILRTRDPDGLVVDAREPGDLNLVFMFPGQGAQYPGLAAEVYQVEQRFRETLDYCAGLVQRHLGVDIRPMMLPSAHQRENAARTLDSTLWAQPVLFSVSFALACTWQEWGVVPDAMIGHSIGEYVAACVAGVLSLEEALHVISTRARLMMGLPAGAMVAVHMEESRLRPLLGPELSLAAVNAPASCVVSGPKRAITLLEARLSEQRIPFRHLRTSHAFHGPMMRPIAEDLLELMRSVRLREPLTPFLSNITGTWITAAQATDPEYWVQHTLGTVRFADGVRELLRDPARVYLEVGPGRALGTFVRQGGSMIRAVVPSLPSTTNQNSDRVLSQALARLWAAGAEVDWEAFEKGERRRRVEVPTYPFERQSYWLRMDWTQAFAGTRHPDGDGDAPVETLAAAEAPVEDPEDATESITAVERIVVATCEQVLGRRNVEASNNFFDLGGDSLLASQFVAQLHDRFPVEIPLRIVFDAPTLIDLARQIDELLLRKLEELAER
jgi:acyl transferase domain-containing protein